MTETISINKNAARINQSASDSSLEQKHSLPALSREILILLIVVADSLVIGASFLLATWDFTPTSFFTALQNILWGKYSSYVASNTLLYILIFAFREAYTRKFLFSQQSLYIVFKTSFSWALIFFVVVHALKLQPPFHPYFLVWSSLSTWFLLSVWRLGLRHILIANESLSESRDRVLMVGWSKDSDLLTNKILRDSGHQYQIVGCTPSAHGKFLMEPPEQIPVLGDYHSLPEIIHQYQPTTLIIADLDPLMGEIIAIADLCVREHVQFKIIPSYFQTFSSGLHLEHVSGIPVLGVTKLPLDHLINQIIKRSLDIIGSVVGLILSAPLILFFGYLIRRESPGPIFYSQIRCGRGGKHFKIYKLRSMKLDAEANGAAWTRENDPRRLEVGKKIRQWNIDEVPQFWNVLMGDMSLVGPRPERPEHIETLKERIPHYNARHFAKPGLTGFAQINGFRGDTDLQERVRYDLYYLENWNVFLDIYIMIRTFFTLSGAY